jgi:large subunit ribosomal protein L6
MSRVGKKPIAVPSGVTVSTAGAAVTVKGAKGQLSMPIPRGISISQEGSIVTLARATEAKQMRALHGMARAILQNMVDGVTTGYSRRLDIVGVGYKAEMRGTRLILTLGFSHPIVLAAPPDVKIETPAPTQIVVTGIDKQLVGQIAAKIRSYRPPEPYKGKGVKYFGEIVRRKAGKTAGK